ncbi:class I SAM-dependent methyltransferase [Magnetospirillum moscoviense]|uniref:C-methyltransferase domain-containing protein n=1 Tax=Magnetospirillum moscoviense TaxID=1437059 RepID=A0A178MBJ4_9PROT|nr:class I SAM-dependent methyltransferase [Magnetospirillum moscoviense]MBF0324307.1 methyltransferase domain-containing protein [Alphaproteobacteria bacterium]OAN45388.1 hypothetical protein A6A05_04515 [Magnetospirillum moscoviense]
MDEQLYRLRTSCRVCDAPDPVIVAPLAPMAAATPTFSLPGTDKTHPAFTQPVPLALALCRQCGMVQVPAIVSADLNYRNYAYRTTNSLGLPEHFRAHARETIDRIRPRPGSLVMEFGSNDGTLLAAFAEQGHPVLGIDPARAIAEAASRRGVPTLADFFGEALAVKLLASHGPAAILLANNVIANIDDLHDVARGIATILAPDGVFVFETQYGPDVIERLLLDTVYHEHQSYFALTPLSVLFARHGLEVIDVAAIWTKGGSIRVTVQRQGGPRRMESSVPAMLADEARRGIKNPAFFAAFNHRIKATAAALHAEIDRVRAMGGGVAGYGVSVGTCTLLAQFDLAGKIDFLVDDDVNKDPELVGPGYRLAVLPPTALIERRPGLTLVFAWRYADPIVVANQAYLEAGGAFLVCLPEPRLITGAS